MERKFYPENFENFLKGHADQFKMSPSKKVWHGIYNDLHPGRRWPSIAMSMIFIFTLVIVGHLNTNNGHTTPLYDLTSLHGTDLKKAVKTSQTVKRSEPKSAITENNSNKSVANDDIASQAAQLPGIKNIQPSSNTGSELSSINEPKSASIILRNKTETNSTDNIETNVTNTSYQHDIIGSSPELNNVNGEKEITNAITSNINKKVNRKQPDASAENIRKPRRISNVIWTYYLSPSYSYRYFSDASINNSVTQKAKIGYEAGTEISFNILKKLQFVTGVQLNYSGYNITANYTHPIIASLTLNGAMPGMYSTYSSMSSYGNNTGSERVKLKNYSWQASIPIGLQYVFGGNENIKFGAVAAFQPTFIIKSQAYMLSSDKRNYLTDPNVTRKWNMNTSLTPFVSFSSNSFNWQIGPQVRYQLLSTYSPQYPVKEHLINYGIRVGISKISK